MSTSADLSARIRTAGHKATTPRITVLAFIEKAKYPLSIQEITKGIGKKIDQVTVYRIVEAFAESGLLRQSDLGGGRVYESSGKKDHHHLICTVCKRMWDFTGCGIENVTRRALKETRAFAEVKGHSLELFGLCATCAQ